MITYSIQTWTGIDGVEKKKLIARGDDGDVISAHGLNPDRINDKDYIAELKDKVSKVKQKYSVVEMPLP